MAASTPAKRKPRANGERNRLQIMTEVPGLADLGSYTICAVSAGRLLKAIAELLDNVPRDGSI